MSWKDRKFFYPFVKTEDGDVLLHLGGDKACRIDSHEDFKSLHALWLWGSIWLSLPAVAAFLYFDRYRQDELAGIAALIFLIVVAMFALRRLLRWKARNLRLEMVRHSVPFSERLRSNLDWMPMWKIRFTYVVLLLLVITVLAMLVFDLSRGHHERLWKDLLFFVAFLAAFLIASHALKVKKELQQQQAGPDSRRSGS